MILMKELNPHKYIVDATITANLHDLLNKVNQIRSAYGKPMMVSSGLRSQEDQARINPGAPKSKHLTGQACDIADHNGTLKAFVGANIKLLEDAGLWCEDFAHTPTWVHFQTVPPGSGKRFFIP